MKLFHKGIAVAAFVLLLIVVADVVARWIEVFVRSKRVKKIGEKVPEHQCKTCSSIDPVSDPAYNMKELAKQSVLLEEHLTVPSKFCPDCCVKHLLHMHGLATEALMLACDNVGRYPLMSEAPDFYQSCMHDWETVVSKADFMNDPGPRLELAAKLRNFRKQLISAYFGQS